jgi:hypothetical protein
MRAAQRRKMKIETQEGKMVQKVSAGFWLGVAVVIFSLVLWAQKEKTKDGPRVTVTGYVRDSGCVHRFHEVVKPLPNGCVEMCVRGGSPLVILTKDDKVYHPISSEMPDVDVRDELLPFVGKLVRVSGHIYERGGSEAITLEHLAEAPE